MKPTCSYCGRVVTAGYGFSYGVLGVRRVFTCSRWWCRWFRQRLRIQLIFAWYDFWIGFYWDRVNHCLYVFPVVCLGAKIDFRPKPLYPNSATAGGET